VSFVTTSKNNWIVSAKAIHGNPYDGHTLKESIDQMERVCNVLPKDIYADMGYKGKIPIHENINLHLSRSGKKKITPWERMWLRRRNAIEPIFSHAKYYHRMNRNHLLGKAGDKINAILSAVGCNFRKLLLAFSLGRTLFRRLSKVRNRITLRAIGLNFKRYWAWILDILSVFINLIETHS